MKVFPRYTKGNRPSAFSCSALIISVVAFPVAVILPEMLRHGAMHAPQMMEEVILPAVEFALPLLIAQVVANRSLVVALRSRGDGTRSLDYAIAAVVISAAWIVLVAVVAWRG